MPRLRAKEKSALPPNGGMVTVNLPAPAIKGICVVYDEQAGDYFVRSASQKSTRDLIGAIWANATR